MGALRAQIGNLLPLPKLENNEDADHSLERKKMLMAQVIQAREMENAEGG